VVYGIPVDGLQTTVVTRCSTILFAVCGLCVIFVFLWYFLILLFSGTRIL